jgi:hypothetical protein
MAREELNDGTGFEVAVKSILELRADIEVEDHRRIGGKDVDIVCRLRSPIGTEHLLVVECKDHQRPLSREQVAKELADYMPLLQNREADQFVLVTRAGIVANAREMFDNKTTKHATLEELTREVLRPDSLLRSIIDSFERDLSECYVPTRCRSINLPWASENYRELYSDFISFSEQSNFSDLAVASRQWRMLTRRTEESNQPSLYTPELFAEVLRSRSNPISEELEPLIDTWVGNDAITQALAIIGSYGTGKSSFAKRIAYSYAKKFRRGSTGRIPILIELRNLGGHQNIESLIIHELHQRYGLTTWTFETFRQLNAAGKLLLILDGFDEMKHGLSQDALFYNFDQLGRLGGKRAKVIICGRPTVFSSDEEQASILIGKPTTYIEHSSSYIQIDIMPFSQAEIFDFLRRFCRSRAPENSDVLEQKIPQLAQLSQGDSEISQLLSRPVHLPMIAELLPSLQISADALKRAKIYKNFVDLCISREMRKQTSPRPTAIDHERFAQEIALAMLISGESRSVRYSDVNEKLILPFVGKGQTVEECKRLLIATCFLERRPPDVLYFPHKSFAEFLVAKALIYRLRQEIPNTDGLGSVMSPEVISFLSEIVELQELRAAALECTKNVGLLEKLISAQDGKLLELLCEPEVIDVIAMRILSLPKILTFHLLKSWLLMKEPIMRDAKARASITRAVRAIYPFTKGALALLVEQILEIIASEPA